MCSIICGQRKRFSVFWPVKNLLLIRAEEIKGSLDRSSDTMTLHGIKQ